VGKSTLTALRTISLALLAQATTHCVATEFCVVQTPKYWIIGADSEESNSYGPQKTADKIAQYGSFVVLRFGIQGPDPPFDIDHEIAATLSGKKDQKRAYDAMKSLFDLAMAKMISEHNAKKSGLLAVSDKEFRAEFAMGFRSIE
jgi:hypothetical protein